MSEVYASREYFYIHQTVHNLNIRKNHVSIWSTTWTIHAYGWALGKLFMFEFENKTKKSSRDQYEGFEYPQTVNLSGNHRCCWNMCIRPAIIVRYILIQFSSNRRLWCPTDCCDIRRSPERCNNRADSSVVVAPVCSLCDIWFEKWRIFLWKLLIQKFARKKMEIPPWSDFEGSP